MHDVAKHDDSKGQYFWVWGALLVLTAVEVVLGYKQIFEPVHMLEVLLRLSIIKSALIIGYFMHLKYETGLMRWMLVISVTACFIIMYFFFFPDAGRILRLGVRQGTMRFAAKSRIAYLLLLVALWAAPAFAQ